MHMYVCYSKSTLPLVRIRRVFVDKEIRKVLEADVEGTADDHVLQLALDHLRVELRDLLLCRHRVCFDLWMIRAEARLCRMRVEVVVVSNKK